MKNFNWAILLIAAFLMIGLDLRADGNNKVLKFSGRIEDRTKKDKYKEFIIGYTTDDGFSTMDKHHFLYPKIDKNGYFQFTLPDLHKPYKFDITLYNTEATKNLWNGNFYAESRDEVQLVLRIGETGSNSFFFSGKGKDKYNLIEELDRQYLKEYYVELNNLNFETFKNDTELGLKMDQLTLLIKRYEAKKHALINRALISSEMKEIINYEYAQYYSDWRWRVEQLYTQNASSRKQVINYYKAHKDSFFDKPGTLSTLCPIYISELSFRLLLEQMMSHRTDKIDIESFYNATKESHYDSKIKDRLLGVFVFSKVPLMNLNPFNSNLSDSLYRDAYKTVTTFYIKTAIIDRIAELNKVKENEKVFETEFILPDGQKFNLRSLRGKVYLIDCWFKGCTGCAIFHDIFEKEIYPKFKDNKDFIVLSVNFDRKQENWIKGMADEKYTSKDYINVATGSGLDHPFMKYYSVKGGPYLMLVGKNSTISYQPETSTVQEWIKRIQAALNEDPLEYSSNNR